MLAPSALIKGIVTKLLPPGFVDDRDADKPVRLGKYGELTGLMAAPTRHQLAEEGSYISAFNPTIGTGLTWVAAQTGYTNTAPNFLIQNNEPNAVGKNIYLDFLKLIATVAATATTAIHYAVVLDNVPRSPTTDNTVAITPTLANPALTTLPKMILKAQNSATASVIPAPSASAVTAARGALGGLNIVGDEMLVVFGSTDAGAQSATTAAEGAGQPGRRVSSSGPVCIPPGWSAAIHIWLVGSSASPAPEFEMGLIAR